MDPPILSPDAATRSTDTDALLSRVSASKLGYTIDEYSINFLSPSQRRNPPLRPALINIGTHARTYAIDLIVKQFLMGKSNDKGKGKEVSENGNENVRKQVVSLGAGSDSRYWRMKESMSTGVESEWNCKWIELDFVEATSSKCRTIWGKSTLKNMLGESAALEKGGTGISSLDYHLTPGDLREFSSTIGIQLLAGPSPILDPTLPTLLLAECVLVYLPPETNSEILSWFTNTFDQGSTVSYDPFGLHDSFGKVMIRNLSTRNLTLPSAESTPTLNSLNQRLLDSGFHSASSLSIKKIRESVIPSNEIARVAKIEMLDEVEELNLVLDHYAITWGKMEHGIPVGLVTR